MSIEKLCNFFYSVYENNCNCSVNYLHEEIYIFQECYTNLGYSFDFEIIPWSIGLTIDVERLRFTNTLSFDFNSNKILFCNDKKFQFSTIPVKKFCKDVLPLEGYEKILFANFIYYSNEKKYDCQKVIDILEKRFSLDQDFLVFILFYKIIPVIDSLKKEDV